MFETIYQDGEGRFSPCDQKYLSPIETIWRYDAWIISMQFHNAILLPPKQAGRSGQTYQLEKIVYHYKSDGRALESFFAEAF